MCHVCSEVLMFQRNVTTVRLGVCMKSLTRCCNAQQCKIQPTQSNTSCSNNSSNNNVTTEGGCVDAILAKWDWRADVRHEQGCPLGKKPLMTSSTPHSCKLLPSRMQLPAMSGRHPLPIRNKVCCSAHHDPGHLTCRLALAG